MIQLSPVCRVEIFNLMAFTSSGRQFFPKEILNIIDFIISLIKDENSIIKLKKNILLEIIL